MDILSMSETLFECNTAFSLPQEGSSVYEVLPDGYIRLLEIIPGDPASEVCCRIKIYDLQRNPEYTALSYVWGSKSDDCTIFLNGQRVFVRKNLWRFLREARKFVPDTFGLFWIDALCINQFDNPERTHQVQIMSRIYQSALRVLAWLGPTYDGSERAMDYLAKASAFKKINRDPFDIHKTTAGVPISLLATRPYWRRLWIVQEVLLAKSIWIMCGDRIAPYERFKQVLLQMHLSQTYSRISKARVSRLKDSAEYQIVNESPAVPIARLGTQHFSEMDLYTVMAATEKHRCTEPRDRVYALLGVVGKGCSGIIPDYDTPIPTLLNAVLRNHHELVLPRDLGEV